MVHIWQSFLIWERLIPTPIIEHGAVILAVSHVVDKYSWLVFSYRSRDMAPAKSVIDIFSNLLVMALQRLTSSLGCQQGVSFYTNATLHAPHQRRLFRNELTPIPFLIFRLLYALICTPKPMPYSSCASTKAEYCCI